MSDDEELSWNQVNVGGGGYEMEDTGFYELEEIDGGDVDVVKDANGMWVITPKTKETLVEPPIPANTNKKTKTSKESTVKVTNTESEQKEQARKKAEAKKRKKLLKKEEQKHKKKRKMGQGGGAISRKNAVDGTKFEKAIRKKLNAINVLKEKMKDGHTPTVGQQKKLEREATLLEQLDGCVNGTLETLSSTSFSSSSNTTSSSSSSSSSSFTDLQEWRQMGLDNTILTNLRALNFLKPTPVQRRCMPLLLHKRKDIIAAAETGSGKTLSFGLPLVQMISWRPLEKRRNESLSALILCPTRELALQVQQHINAICTNTTVTTCCIVGGISEDKQIRLLNKRPDIVVGTPGRLWIHISQGHSHLVNLHELKYLVLDEADRMLDRGHYAELNEIVLSITRTRDDDDVEDEDIPDQGNEEGDGDNKIKFPIVNQKEIRSKGSSKIIKRQTMLFSATMMLDGEGRINAKLSSKHKKGKRGQKKKTSTSKILQDLMARVGCRGDPSIVDMTGKRTIGPKTPSEALLEATDAKDAKTTEHDPLTRQDTTKKSGKSSGATIMKLPESLQLARIECTQDDKDLYVYYFCVRHPGRTVIFANSIAVVRKVTLLLKLMKINVFPLHAQMQQRQRLKNVDRFKSQKNIVLVASDVAARGLDVPNVDHVLHFNIPRTPEIFIHRSGRTARANKSGLAISLISPQMEERRGFNNICKTLNIQRDDIDRFDINMAYMPHVRTRVKLGKRLRTEVTKNSRNKADVEWFRQQAEAADIYRSEDEEDDGGSVSRRKETTKEERLRYEMNEMLSVPLIGRGTASMKYQFGR